MREILFRGKRKDNGEWVYGFYCPVCFGFFPCSPAIISKELMDSGCWKPEEVIPETVGQYTGLTDKYGKKIFEGDIIESSGNKSKAVSVICYGEFEPKMFYDLIEAYVSRSGIRPTEKICGLYAKSLKGEEMMMTNASSVIKVIGNIHDNGELLKVGETV